MVVSAPTKEILVKVGRGQRDMKKNIIRETGLYCEFAMTKETRDWIQFRHRIVLRKFAKAKETRSKYDLKIQILLKFALAKETGYRIRFGRLNCIAMWRWRKRFRQSLAWTKRDMASNIVRETELYHDICIGKRDMKPSTIQKSWSYWVCNGKRDSASNIIWKTTLYCEIALAKEKEISRNLPTFRQRSNKRQS